MLRFAFGFIFIWSTCRDCIAATTPDVSIAARPELVVQSGHTAIHVNSVAISDDDHWLVAGGSDGLAKLWDLKSHQEMHSLHSGAEEIDVVAFGRDGNVVAGAGSDGKIRIWALDNDEPEEIISASPNITAMSFSSDGNWLAWCAGKDAFLWSRRAKSVPRSFSHHELDALAIAFSPDSRVVASAGADGRLHVFHINTGIGRWESSSVKAPLNSLAFSPSGTTIASGSPKGSIAFWSASSGNLLKDLMTYSEVRALMFQGEKIVVSASAEEITRNMQIKTWNFDTRSQITTISRSVKLSPFMSEFVGHWPISVSSSGRFVGYAYDWSTIVVIDVAGSIPDVELGRYAEAVNAVAVDEAQTWLAAGSAQAIRLWNMQTGERRTLNTGFSKNIRRIAFSPDGSSITAVSEAEEVSVWNALSGVPTKSLHDPADFRYGDGLWLAGGRYDGTIHLWRNDASKAEPDINLTTQPIRGQARTRLAINVNGTLVATANQLFGQVAVWGVDKPDAIQKVTGAHFTEASDIQFAPNSRTVAWGTLDGHVKVMDVGSGFILDLCCHAPRWVESLGYSTDSSLLATGGQDKTIRVWKVDNLRQVEKRDLALLKGHEDAVTSVTFTQDGHLLVSGSLDGTTRVWDWRRGVAIVR